VSNGGLSVSDYTIQYSKDGISWQTFSHMASPATSVTVTGLTNGVAYFFRVAGVNAIGTGLYSDNSSAVTPAALPDAPTAVASIRGNRQVQLSWAAPASNGGLSVTDYTIQYSKDKGKTWATFNDGVSTSRSTTVTGLDVSRTYVFRVAAINGVGTSSYSLASSAVMPQTVPDAPSNLIATAGNGRVSLAWTAPTSNGGRSVTNYVVQYSTNNGGAWITFSRPPSTALSTTVAGLANGTGCVFRVFAVSAVGRSFAPATSATVIPRTVPGVPITVRGSVSNGSVAITWAAPSRNGGVAITDYLIQFSSNKGKTWTTFEDGISDLRAAAVTGLTGGTTYVFRVAARNVAGWGAFSVPSVALKV